MVILELIHADRVPTIDWDCSRVSRDISSFGRNAFIRSKPARLARFLRAARGKRPAQRLGDSE